MFVIKNKLDADFKDLFLNYFFLITVNIANLIIPLLQYPFLIDKLGLQNFGNIMFSLSFITYFSVVLDYGFNFYAVRELVIVKEKKDQVNRIFSDITYARMLLLLISVSVFLIIVFLVPSFEKDLYLHTLTFLSVIPNLFLPQWLYQGFDKLRIYSILMLFARVMALLIVLYQVKCPNDLLLIPVINFCCFAFVSILSFLYIRFKLKISLVKIDLNGIKKSLIEARYLFISNVSISLYTNTIVFLLGFFCSKSLVGSFSIADKIIQAIRSTFTPFSQLVFPKLVFLAQTSKSCVVDWNRKILFFGSVVIIFICCLVFIFSNQLVYLIANKYDQEAILCLKLFSVLPLVFFLHIIFAMFTILVFGYTDQYGKIILSAGLLSVFFCPIFIYYFNIRGAVLGVVLIEIYLLVRYFIFSLRLKLI
ncbi:hypothetical protein AX766_09425 [Flavobacterium covae]|uniref:oligosaccharide flippase family protein n=1 Tax=Flavobacterium covae TaxID=2906076 RepID=UPI0007C1B4DC|nr:oligosaccharide flippase family protein [Flavobacterium covae]AND64622.1 hypothetical protein AX766_09425 [Flavobacterium covae]